MSRLKELIEELCPDGVEKLRVKDVAIIKNGRDHKHLGDGDIPVYGSGGIMRYVDTASYDGPSVLLPRKGSINNVFYVDGPFWNVDTVFYTIVDESKMLIKFFYYTMCYAHVEQYGTEAARPSLTQSILNDVQIFVPPIEVQREVVRILDSMQELDDALSEELEFRNKQLEESIDLIVEKVSAGTLETNFGSVASIARGASPRPIKAFMADAESGIHWVKIGDVPVGGKYITDTKEYVTPEGAAKSRSLRSGSFVLSNSMSFGRPYIMGIDGCIHDGWLSITEYEDVFDKDFLYYLLRSSRVQKHWVMAASSGTVSNLNADIVKDTVIPVPDMADQIEGAAKLDTMMECINVIDEELQARRKQFEYYRDKLLDFPEKVA